MIIEAVAWSDEAAEWLAEAVLVASVEDYRRQVESEDAVLFRITDDDGPICYYILRVDHYAEKKIGVIVAATARARFSVYDHLMSIVEGQFLGCDELIQYCSRAGAVRKLVRQNWAPTHIAMRKVLNHG